MRKFIITLGLMLSMALALNAQVTFKASNDGRNQATFESDAALEHIVGVSNEINVVVMLDPNNITKHAMGKVSVDLRSLKTGIGLRDEHLNSKNWLYTEKYPYAVFKLKGISNASSKKLEDGKKIKATLNGTLTIHGVTHDISVPGEITYYKESARTKVRMKGNLLKGKAAFDIKLSDYGVKIPSMVAGKVDENIQIATNFIASDAMAMGENPCGPMKMKGKCNPCNPKKMMNKAKCNPCSPKK